MWLRRMYANSICLLTLAFRFVLQGSVVGEVHVVMLYTSTKTADDQISILNPQSGHTAIASRSTHISSGGGRCREFGSMSDAREDRSRMRAWGNEQGRNREWFDGARDTGSYLHPNLVPIHMPTSLVSAAQGVLGLGEQAETFETRGRALGVRVQSDRRPGDNGEQDVLRAKATDAESGSASAPSALSPKVLPVQTSSLREAVSGKDVDVETLTRLNREAAAKVKLNKHCNVFHHHVCARKLR
jgi:hypothetical protein